jgi:SPFH domain / Band 7 family
VADRPGEMNDETKADLSGPTSVLGAAEPLEVGRRPKSGGSGSGGDGNGGSKRRAKLPRVGLWWLLIIAAVVVVLALGPAFVSGLKKTPRDRVGISYGGGPFEGAHYQRIVQPGSGLFFNGFYDPLYLYPSDQVNYIISKQPSVGSPNPDSVVAPTQDRVQVTYQVAVYFKLNIDKLREFHEQLGLRYRAYTPSGWNNLIRDTFRQQIENALQEETRRVDVAQLFGSASFLVELQDRVQTKLTQRLKDALGEQFFCAPTYHPGGACGDPTFVIKKVDIPQNVAVAFQQNRISAINILTKQNEIAQRQAEAQSIQALGLSGQEYDTLKAIESGKINFWVLPNNAGVTLNTPGTGGAATTPTTKAKSGN